MRAERRAEEKRIGRDGKARKLPEPRKTPSDPTKETAPQSLDEWCGEMIVMMTEAYATLPANERGEFLMRVRRAIDKLERDGLE